MVPLAAASCAEADHRCARLVREHDLLLAYQAQEALVQGLDDLGGAVEEVAQGRIANSRCVRSLDS